MNFNPENRGGFTLIEALLVVALLVVIFGLSVGLNSNFYGTHALISERDNLVSLLRHARSLAMDNVGESSHGVFVSSNQYVLFNGDSYALRDPQYDVVFPRTSSVGAEGLPEVVFSPLEGNSGVSGTIAVFLGDGRSQIHINNEGAIGW
ncbi:MAG: hypothetical protein AAB655_01570 [Patescibacteria group bacterium]